MAQKLFGNTGSGRYSGKNPNASPQDEFVAPKTKKKKSKLRIVAVLLAVILLIECAYCLVIFSNIPLFVNLREMYISTAYSTMTHQWLASYFIPGDIVMDVVNNMTADLSAQINVNSNWGDETQETQALRSPSVGFSTDQAAAILGDLAQASGMTGDATDFFALFHELDEESTYAYVDEHPEAIENGWDHFYVNEAGLNDSGTSIYTNAGDQVLAINAEHGLLAIRVRGTGYRGVLVIGKDPSRLTLAPSSTLGSAGEHVGQIADANNGLVSMTGSGFVDTGGGYTEGALIAGAAMHNGAAYGSHYGWGYKRIELHTDNRLYITDAQSSYGDGCTDATEFTPALIVDGQILSTSGALFTSLNPRACLGQTKDEAIMFLVIEGRLTDSLGADADECAEILSRYDCYQAMNLDGGSSAMLYYEGEYITRCSNTNAPYGRKLPNAWVYCRETVPDP